MENMSVKIVEAEKVTVFEAFMKSKRDELFVSGEGYVKGYHFGHHFVGDFLTDEKIRMVTSESPAMIISQTGTGKSTLVLDKILELVKDEGKRVLILVSRTALALQYKREVAKQEMPQLLEELTSLGIKRRTEFGTVEIWTYQFAYYELIKPDRDFHEFGAVVFDEFHYFVHDAAFDIFTYETLRLALQKFHHCRRFYLSATPDMAADKIIEEEWRNQGMMCKLPPYYYEKPPVRPHFYIYEFQADYGYVLPTFFKEDQEIVDLIKKSQEKFLVCVDNKERGENMQRQLGEEAEFIDAELKNGEKSEIVEKIISNERFERRVLIVTSFLDVGVNLLDEGLHNVVVFSTCKTHFLQSIGRKRRRNNEKINLYIKIPTLKYLRKLHGVIMGRLEELLMKVNGLDCDNYFTITELEFPLYIKKEYGKIRIRYNGLTLTNLKFRYCEIEKIIDSGNKYESKEEGVAKEYLRWLGIEEKYSECHWIGVIPNKRYRDLSEFLEQHCEKDLDSVEFENFRKEFIVLHNELGCESWRKDRLPQKKRINEFLTQSGMNYRMVSLQNPLRHRIERG